MLFLYNINIIKKNPDDIDCFIFLEKPTKENWAIVTIDI